MKAARLFLLALLCATPLHAALVREEGALYLEDALDRPLKIAVAAQAPIYFDLAMQRYLGVLRQPQVVELLAIAGGAYRVRGQARQGGVAGWVEAKNLAPLDEKFLAALKESARRRTEVKALIEKNEVAINMTPEEVAASLGKPAKKTSRLDATGRHETWDYVRYERIPQQVTGYDRNGQLVSQTRYVKIPNGRLAVIFDNNLVSALEQTEGSLTADSRVRIVTAPVEVRY